MPSDAHSTARVRYSGHAALARRIRRAVARAHLSGDAADVNDLALSSTMLGREPARFDPISANGRRGEKHAFQIQIEHSIPIFLGDFR